MKVLCVFGEHNYGVPERGLGYEYSNFIPALRQLGHKTVFFESLNKCSYSDFADLNRQLLQAVEKEQPDIVFCVLMTYEIWLETLQLIREGSHAALIHWATDDSWKYEQHSQFYAPLFDVHATTYPSAMEKSVLAGLEHVMLSQWAADSSRMHSPLASNQCRYPVSFVGSAYGNRSHWITDLQQRGIDVATFGYGWPHGPVTLSEMVEIMRSSVVSLNFADSGVVMEGGKPLRSRQIKARVFEVPGGGGLLATEDADHLAQYYEPGEEIVVFDGADDLANKIHRLLADPERRDKMAQAGFQRTKREHTYEDRFAPLISKALERRQMRGNAVSGIDFNRFEIIAATHRPGMLLRVFAWLLMQPCILIWGRRRGMRAARRFLFELSWRICGGKTYTALGWPGRLFYDHS